MAGDTARLSEPHARPSLFLHLRRILTTPTPSLGRLSTVVAHPRRSLQVRCSSVRPENIEPYALTRTVSPSVALDLLYNAARNYLSGYRGSSPDRMFNVKISIVVGCVDRPIHGRGRGPCRVARTIPVRPSARPSANRSPPSARSVPGSAGRPPPTRCTRHCPRW